MVNLPFRLVLFFRKRYPTAFSIERLFEQLSAEYTRRGLEVIHEELPLYNNQLGNVRQNTKWAGTQVQNLSTERPTIAHVTGDVNSIVFGLGRCAATVITFHDCNPLLRYPRWHPRYWFYRWVIFEWPARRASAVTVISEKSRRELVQLTNCPADKLTVIPNFVDPTFTHRPKKFNADYPTILQIGVKENKNLTRLAQALRGLPCRLEIIGTPGAADLTALRESGIDFHSQSGISDEAVRQHYVDCDILAFVSTYEGFGLPILEAQATGRPVVTSDLSPHREVAGPGGALIVDPYDPAAIRRGIECVLDPSVREALIDRGRANVANYHIEAIAARYLNLYNSLL